MKKFTVIIALLGMAFYASGVMAQFGGVKLPSSGTGAETAVKKTATKAVEASINDKLKKKGCAFANSTTENQITCNLDQVIADLKSWKGGLESTVANDFNIHVQASANDSDLAWKRVSFVQDKLRASINYWDWYTHKTTAEGDNLKIWVTAH